MGAVAALWLLAAAPMLTAESTCMTGAAVPDPERNAGLVADCEALIAAMEAWPAGAAVNWSTHVAIAEWQGVTLSPAPSRVTALDLSYRNLRGTMPGDLGDLSALEWLDASNNELSGSIPSELGRLSSLEVLNLGDNDFNADSR